MSSPEQEDILIINPSIHKTTKLSRAQFLEKVSFVEAIRTIENNTYLTIYPCDYNEYLLIEQFHNLINKGDFSFLSLPIKINMYLVLLFQKLFFLGLRIQI